MEFLQKREWEWSIKDQASMLGAKRGLASAPTKVRRKIFRTSGRTTALTGINAGEIEPVHDKTLETVHRQHLVEVQGQSDVAIMGVPFVGPYNVNSVMNPILAACMGLGYYFNSYRGNPIVRKDGAVILYHPVDYEFSQLHHPSYVDFFEEVLSESTDPATIEAKFEKQYAEDPWYIHLYRTSNAYHGVHPFYMWYWISHALDHCGDIVWVGANRKTVERMGFRSASTLQDALEMVSHSVGRSPSHHLPAQPAAPARGRSLMGTNLVKFSRGTVQDVRQVARGWRWGRRPQVPRSAEPYVIPKETSVFPTRWARTPAAIAVREVLLQGGLNAVHAVRGEPAGERARLADQVARPGRHRGEPLVAPGHPAGALHAAGRDAS